MAPLSSFSPSIWRPWRFLPWSPCLHLKLHGTSLVRFSVNLAPLTFSSLEHLLALETAWHPSRPFLRQFGAPDIFFHGAPACTWNCMALLSSFSKSIWHPWRLLRWSPGLHLKLHGTPLVLFSVNLAPLTFSSLEPLLALETAYVAAPFVLFYVNLAPLTFSSLEPLLALETAWRPSRHIDLTFFLSLFFLALSFFPFFFLIPFFSSFFLFSPFSLSFPFLFSFFLAPLWWPRGAQAPKAPPKIRPCIQY